MRDRKEENKGLCECEEGGICVLEASEGMEKREGYGCE